jgi:hypothetical protein
MQPLAGVFSCDASTPRRCGQPHYTKQMVCQERRKNTLYFNTICNSDRTISVGGGVIAGTLVASLVGEMS